MLEFAPNVPNDKPWIAYVGYFHFPEGEAASRRVLGVAQSLAGGNYRVVVGCKNNKPLHLTPLMGDNTGLISYIGLGEQPLRTANPFDKGARVLFSCGARTVKWLSSQSSLPSAVILYGSDLPYLLKLLPWCKRHQIPLLVDLVEWYDGRHMLGGLYGPFHLNNELAMRHIVLRTQGVIAISSYLKEYYHQRGLPVLRIPPTLDTKKFLPRLQVESTDQLKLFYGGNPGKKDLLEQVINGMQQIDPSGQQIKLVIAGPTSEQICRLIKCNELPHNIITHGYLPHTEVMKLATQADYLVLLRPLRRFTQAGFPTKVCESLAVGTPVICNVTSDIDEYIRDGQEGLHCANHTPEAFVIALQRAFALSKLQRQQMRNAARIRAEQVFDYKNYIAPMKAFLRDIT